MHRQVTSVEETALTNAIVDVLAAAHDVDPMAVRTRLYEYLDPEALSRLAARAESAEAVTWELSLDLGDVTLTLRGDDRVVVTAE